MADARAVAAFTASSPGSSCSPEPSSLYPAFDGLSRPLEASTPPASFSSTMTTPEPPPPPPLPAEELLNSLGSLGAVSQISSHFPDVPQRYPELSRFCNTPPQPPELHRFCNTPPRHYDLPPCAAMNKGPGNGTLPETNLLPTPKSWMNDPYPTPPPPPSAMSMMYPYPITSISPPTNANMTCPGTITKGCSRIGTPLPPIGSWSNYSLYPPPTPSSQMWFPRPSFPPSWSNPMGYHELGFCAPLLKAENNFSTSNCYGYSPAEPSFTASNFAAPRFTSTFNTRLDKGMVNYRL